QVDDTPHSGLVGGLDKILGCLAVTPFKTAPSPAQGMHQIEGGVNPLQGWYQRSTLQHVGLDDLRTVRNAGSIRAHHAAHSVAPLQQGPGQALADKPAGAGYQNCSLAGIHGRHCAITPLEGKNLPSCHVTWDLFTLLCRAPTPKPQK